MKRMVIVVALLCVFGLGMVFSILGAIKLNLVPQLGGINDAQFGMLISALMFTCVIMQLILGPLVDKYGHKPFAILGFILVGVAILILSFTTSYELALGVCVLLGIGGMSLNTVGNTLIPVILFEGKNPAAASNLGNVFFGLGAFIVPALMGWLMKLLGFQMALTVLALIALLPLITAFLAQYPDVSVGFELKTGLKLLKQPALIIGALALVCYIGMETSMGGWITSYLSGIQFSAENAGLVLSFFWISMMVGRLIASQIKVLTQIGATLVSILALVSAVAIYIMIVTTNPTVAVFAVILSGLAFAPIFPTIVGVTFSRFKPSQYGSVFGVIFSAGLLFGGTTIPPAIGRYAENTSISQGLMILVVAALILAVIGFFMRKTRASEV